jgi:hypothetical protein
MKCAKDMAFLYPIGHPKRQAVEDEINKLQKEIQDLTDKMKIKMELRPNPNIKGYKKGNVVTVKKLRSMKEGTVIHLHYLDEDGTERTNGFHKLTKDSPDEYGTEDGFPIPLEKNGMEEDDILKDCDNSGWTFTVREAVGK